ncbi:MAG: O-methyltransferase [Bacteroidales bacterium]|nr:O-methyltransferase [Bacteroidales bacterium]
MTEEQYSLEHSSLPVRREALAWIERQTHLRTRHSRMLSGLEVGGLLSLISRMVAPHRILELGVFTGYSTVCLSEGLAEGGSIDSVEINDELCDIIDEGYRMAGISDKVRLHYGDAAQLLLEIEGPFDLVYIDADKRDYALYWDLIVDKVRPGGVIVADNVLWSGKVCDDRQPQDVQSRGIMAYNEKVAQDPRVRNLVLPLRDGLNIAVRL